MHNNIIDFSQQDCFIARHTSYTLPSTHCLNVTRFLAELCWIHLEFAKDWLQFWEVELLGVVAVLRRLLSIPGGPDSVHCPVVWRGYEIGLHACSQPWKNHVRYVMLLTSTVELTVDSYSEEHSVFHSCICHWSKTGCTYTWMNETLWYGWLRWVFHGCFLQLYCMYTHIVIKIQ